MKDKYVSPLSERYASKELQYIFSADMKFKTWRKLWIALAETECELGLSQNGRPVITLEQIEELKAYQDDINYDVAKEREREVRLYVVCDFHSFRACDRNVGNKFYVNVTNHRCETAPGIRNELGNRLIRGGTIWHIQRTTGHIR